MSQIYQVTGELTDDRTLKLDEALPEAVGKVRVTVELLSVPKQAAPEAIPKGTAILGRGKGKLISYIEDDEHLKDFEETMP